VVLNISMTWNYCQLLIVNCDFGQGKQRTFVPLPLWKSVPWKTLELLPGQLCTLPLPCSFLLLNLFPFLFTLSFFVSYACLYWSHHSPCTESWSHTLGLMDLSSSFSLVPGPLMNQQPSWDPVPWYKVRPSSFPDSGIWSQSLKPQLVCACRLESCLHIFSPLGLICTVPFPKQS
jgi:hypothetical protein